LGHKWQYCEAQSTKSEATFLKGKKKERKKEKGTKVTI
jgi:hypothetical protein